MNSNSPIGRYVLQNIHWTARLLICVLNGFGWVHWPKQKMIEYCVFIYMGIITQTFADAHLNGSPWESKSLDLVELGPNSMCTSKLPTAHIEFIKLLKQSFSLLHLCFKCQWDIINSVLIWLAFILLSV